MLKASLEEELSLHHAAGYLHKVGDRGFADAMQGVLGTAIEPENAIETLVNGDEIYPSMLKAIGGAKKTINFETYIYWPGDIARRFADALSDRALAGVKVNVILDFVGSLPMDENLVLRMRKAGVSIVRFRPLHWYTIDRLNNRTHRRVLVVDGITGFTGGVGIADTWLGNARNPDEWRDNHYRIEGRVVGGLQSAFTEHWLEATGEVLEGDSYFPQLHEAGTISAQTMKSSPFSESGNIYLGTMIALSAAERHIRIGSAYFVPNEKVIELLLEARRRGVEIEVMVPGAATDVEEVRRASRYFWGRLLDAGVKIYEFRPTMYHVKIITVDEGWASLGSANFDERSFRLNDEVNVNVYDPQFVRTQAAQFDDDKRRAKQVTLAEWRNRSIRLKLSDWFWSRLRPLI